MCSVLSTINTFGEPLYRKFLVLLTLLKYLNVYRSQFRLLYQSWKFVRVGLQTDKGVIEIKHLFGISRLGWPLWRNLANYAHVIVLINMALLAENNSKNRHHVETATKNEKGTCSGCAMRYRSQKSREGNFKRERFHTLSRLATRKWSY